MICLTGLQPVQRSKYTNEEFKLNTIHMERGPVMADIGGTALNEEERQRLLHPSVGAVILFSRNYESPEQLAKLTDEIHRLRDPQLLIAVDHEGGRVQRFRDGFTRLPAVRHFGAQYDVNPDQALDDASTAGWLMAVELLEAGVDFSFAPIADIDSGLSTVIGDRAFHSDPDIAGRLAVAYMQGMRKAGMAATAKHFPGHGCVQGDSHHVIPVDQRSLEDIQQRDLLPFRRMISNGVEGIMTAHVIYPQLDEQPPTFSRFWLQEVLRDDLGYDGIIFSDDLSMKGASVAGGPLERAEKAMSAGCDMILLCNDTDALDQVIDGLPPRPGPGRRLAAFEPRLQLAEPLLEMPDWHDAVARMSHLA